MRFFPDFLTATATLGASVLLFVGCGGGGTNNAPAASGAVSVTLVDGPTTDYRAINLNIQSVQIHTSATAGDSGWLTLSSPNKTLDLLKLQGGVVEALGTTQGIGVGTYQMLRLLLGTGNTVTLNDGTIQPLTVPSGQQSGIKIPLHFTVQAGTTADVWIDFDAAHSIHMVATGSGKYMLRPVVRGFMQTATGSVSGTLTGPAGIPLAGAAVMAESVDTAGNVTILRTATTTLSGTYSLNLLPIGQTFYVVSQPVVGSAVYTAQASGVLTLSPTAATATANLTFALALGTGTVSGVLTPAALDSQSDTVYLVQSLATGLSSTSLVVASVNSVVGIASETYSLPLLPVGSYQLVAIRSALNLDGTLTLTRSISGASFAVTAGTETTQNLTF